MSSSFTKPTTSLSPFLSLSKMEMDRGRVKLNNTICSIFLFLLFFSHCSVSIQFLVFFFFVFSLYCFYLLSFYNCFLISTNVSISCRSTHCLKQM